MGVGDLGRDRGSCALRSCCRVADFIGAMFIGVGDSADDRVIGGVAEADIDDDWEALLEGIDVGDFERERCEMIVGA